MRPLTEEKTVFFRRAYIWKMFSEALNGRTRATNGRHAWGQKYLNQFKKVC